MSATSIDPPAVVTDSLAVSVENPGAAGNAAAAAAASVAADGGGAPPGTTARFWKRPAGPAAGAGDAARGGVAGLAGLAADAGACIANVRSSCFEHSSAVSSMGCASSANPAICTFSEYFAGPGSVIRNA